MMKASKNSFRFKRILNLERKETDALSCKTNAMSQNLFLLQYWNLGRIRKTYNSQPIYDMEGLTFKSLYRFLVFYKYRAN